MPRTRRHRLALGVYRDSIGVSIVASVRGLRREHRLPASTPLPAAKEARRNLIRELEETQPRTDAGTVAAAVDAYLDKLPTGRHKDDRAWLLAPWVAALGTKALADLTRPQLTDTLMQWERDGLAPGTRNHRLSALRVLWRTVTTDPDTPHPCERLPRARAPRPHLNRARRMDLIAFVLTHVSAHKGSHAKAQIELLAWTGQPAAMLAKIRPEHVRWTAKPPEVYLQPRRKGQGADAAWVSLLPEGAVALRTWLALDAYDAPWHNGVIWSAWRRAILAAQAALTVAAKGAKKPARERLLQDAASLAGMRPYDLRHSFLTALAMSSQSLQAVAEYARHSNLSTTQGYIRGASATVVRDAITGMAATTPKPAKAGKVIAFR